MGRLPGQTRVIRSSSRENGKRHTRTKVSCNHLISAINNYYSRINSLYRSPAIPRATFFPVQRFPSRLCLFASSRNLCSTTFCAPH
ncbi:hypothetical protein MCOR31_002080 [Pyricularia oryzae]|nr:hypothetical protein MCOR28_002940 [Pyricularia oryzae]KAI6375722.1 hypothetical protein MCOR31_002080 [Pyricularia oryzae]KAI6393404.1 hypothetical protein MCOR24_009768 [Pyricularia oryzae]KAI6540251.1 hypothetical protein MCOR05_004341 [Pyricularia oryzae]